MIMIGLRMALINYHAFIEYTDNMDIFYVDICVRMCGYLY